MAQGAAVGFPTAQASFPSEVVREDLHVDYLGLASLHVLGVQPGQHHHRLALDVLGARILAGYWALGDIPTTARLLGAILCACRRISACFALDRCGPGRGWPGTANVAAHNRRNSVYSLASVALWWLDCEDNLGCPLAMPCSYLHRHPPHNDECCGNSAGSMCVRVRILHRPRPERPLVLRHAVGVSLPDEPPPQIEPGQNQIAQWERRKEDRAKPWQSFWSDRETLVCRIRGLGAETKQELMAHRIGHTLTDEFRTPRSTNRHFAAGSGNQRGDDRACEVETSIPGARGIATGAEGDGCRL